MEFLYDFANYLEDTLKIIEAPKSNEKETLISVTIHGEFDRDEVKSKIKALDHVIIRGPVFEKEVKSIEEFHNNVTSGCFTISHSRGV